MKPYIAFICALNVINVSLIRNNVLSKSNNYTSIYISSLFAFIIAAIITHFFPNVNFVILITSFIGEIIMELVPEVIFSFFTLINWLKVFSTLIINYLKMPFTLKVPFTSIINYLKMPF